MILVTFAVLAISPTISNRITSQKPKKPAAVLAQAKIQNTMVATVIAQKDDRAERLAAFFSANNSPFTPYAADFIAIADKYDLDWTFLPAIANVESQLGKAVPAFSYNPYGWNNGNYRFSSWTAATEIVASGIRTRYAPTGEVTAYRIGHMYAESPTWAQRVNSFQTQILNF